MLQRWYKCLGEWRDGDEQIENIYGEKTIIVIQDPISQYHISHVIHN